LSFLREKINRVGAAAENGSFALNQAPTFSSVQFESFFHSFSVPSKMRTQIKDDY
jgi:hypothetical protein